MFVHIKMHNTIMRSLRVCLNEKEEEDDMVDNMKKLTGPSLIRSIMSIRWGDGIGW